MPRGLVSPLRTRQRPCCPLRTRQALFTWLLMGQRQSAARLVGICVVVAGLGLPMMEYRHSDGAGTEDIAWGIALTFGGTFFYALEYSLCERVYTLYEKPLDARQLCFFTGASRRRWDGPPLHPRPPVPA